MASKKQKTSVPKNINRRRHSKIYDLPSEVIKDVNTLLLEKDKTYADIISFIKEKHKVDLSDSGLSRYNENFMSEVRETEILRDQALWLNDNPESALALEKLTATMITRRLATAMMDGTLKILEDSKLIDAFAKLQRSSTQREAWSREIQKQVKKVVEDVTKIAKKGGFSDDTVNSIKSKILGIAK